MLITPLLSVRDNHAFSFCLPSTLLIIFFHIKLHTKSLLSKSKILKEAVTFNPFKVLSSALSGNLLFLFQFLSKMRLTKSVILHFQVQMYLEWETEILVQMPPSHFSDLYLVHNFSVGQNSLSQFQHFTNGDGFCHQTMIRRMGGSESNKGLRAVQVQSVADQESF